MQFYFVEQEFLAIYMFKIVRIILWMSVGKICVQTYDKFPFDWKIILAMPGNQQTGENMHLMKKHLPQDPRHTNCAVF